MAEHHPTLSPSKLPALELCGSYEGQGFSKNAQAGTDKHSAIAQILEAEKTGQPWGFDFLFYGLDTQGQSEIEWGLKYLDSVLEETCLSRSVLEIEQKVHLFPKEGGFTEKTFGSLDVAFHNHLVDWKFGQVHPYEVQMMTYALARMQSHGFNQIEVHEVYPKLKRFKRYSVTKEEAERRVFGVIEKVESGDKTKSKNEWCSFCKFKATCPEFTGVVSQAIQAEKPVSMDTEDFKKAVELVKENAVLNPDQIDFVASQGKAWAEALALASMAEKWAEEIKAVAKDAVFKCGQIPGLLMKSKAGRAKMENTGLAFNRSGLDPDKFLGAVTLSKTSLTDAMMDAGPEHIEAVLSGFLGEVPEFWKPGRGGKFTKAVMKDAVDLIFQDLWTAGEPSVSIEVSIEGLSRMPKHQTTEVMALKSGLPPETPTIEEIKAGAEIPVFESLEEQTTEEKDENGFTLGV